MTRAPSATAGDGPILARSKSSREEEKRTVLAFFGSSSVGARPRSPSSCWQLGGWTRTPTDHRPTHGDDWRQTTTADGQR